MRGSVMKLPLSARSNRLTTDWSPASLSGAVKRLLELRRASEAVGVPYDLSSKLLHVEGGSTTSPKNESSLRLASAIAMAFLSFATLILTMPLYSPTQFVLL